MIPDQPQQITQKKSRRNNLGPNQRTSRHCSGDQEFIIGAPARGASTALQVPRCASLLFLRDPGSPHENGFHGT